MALVAHVHSLGDYFIHLNRCCDVLDTVVNIMVVQDETRPAYRRWFRYSLRTLFVLMTLFCIYLGWALNWKRQREAALIGDGLSMGNENGKYIREDQIVVFYSDRVPSLLQPFQVTGVGLICCDEAVPAEEMAKLAALFPEARIGRCATEYTHE